MKIELDPAVYELLRDRDDIESYVNSILATYLYEGFIRMSDVAGVVVADPIVTPLSATGLSQYDAATHEFHGVTFVGEEAGNSIFIPSQKLRDLVEENKTIMVMKSPRTEGVSIKRTPFMILRPEKTHCS